MSKDGEKAPLLELQDLKMHFPIREELFRKALVRAVDGVSLTLHEGQTLGLVGESGCGKSTLGRSVVRLYRPTSGRVLFQGKDVTRMGQRKLRKHRRDFQMVFQDPAESLNARLSVEDLIAEPLAVQGIGKRWQRQKKVAELLDAVGLPRHAAHKFPFEFSGGQRQRIGIARALAVNPKLLVLDEPVSALDVSVQAQVMNLLLNLQVQREMAYLFISHDLSVVKHMSDFVAVMYLGRIVEMAPAEVIYKQPLHAYTKALISAIPIPSPFELQQRQVLEGDVPSPINPPEGCAFGHRVGHRLYPASIGEELPFEEVFPGHWVQRCPCCVRE